MLKKLLKKTIPILKWGCYLFYDKNYIQGRYFDNALMGYKWALKSIWMRNILRLAPSLPFPAALTCTISNGKNIHFHPDDLNNFQSPGTYYQNFSGHIYIGKGSYVAPNVGIITANHQIDDLTTHTEGQDVHIGEHCWIGMNSVVLPGVVLGNKTIVAAGAVVTKSFPDGNVVLAGVPAIVIKDLKNE